MLSLIITNYNTWALTERCVKSVMEAGTAHCIDEIIIVDDFSTQQAPEFMLKYSKIKLIYNAQNYGYAKCVNIGFEKAKNEFCLLLDSDAYLMAGIHYILSSFEKNKSLGILGFKLVDEKEKNTGRGEKEANVWSLILGQKLDQKIGHFFVDKKGLFTLYSCAIAIRKKAFEEVGGFDESFDFIDADQDFSMKINRSDYQIAINEGVVIFHKGGGSPQLTSKRVIRQYQNRIKLLRKYNKLPFETVIKFLIKTRLQLELLLMKTYSENKMSKCILDDKIYSRRHLIKNINSY